MGICNTCGRPYEWRCQEQFIDGQRTCLHDGECQGAVKEVDLIAGGRWSRRTAMDRAKYKKDMLQPYRADGKPNEHYQKIYGKNNEAYRPKKKASLFDSR